MLFHRRQRRIQRVLIVEDEPLVAFDNEHLLKENGYQVVATVDSVAHARAAIDAEEIDLVLCDIGLSGEGDGTDVARAAAEKGVPVLFVTGSCSAEAQRLAVGCLAKPYSPKALLNAINVVDRCLQGDPPKRPPRELTLYENA